MGFKDADGTRQFGWSSGHAGLIDMANAAVELPGSNVLIAGTAQTS